MLFHEFVPSYKEYVVWWRAENGEEQKTGTISPAKIIADEIVQ
jgi:hypothetical protein